MRAIAEYIMRGRSQAVMVALVGSWVPILTQATLGLVTLRRGWQDGVLVMMWALLPSLAAFWLGDMSFSLAVSSVAVVLVSVASAVVLRTTVSWSASLATLVATSAFGALLTVLLSDDIVAEMKAFVEQLLKDSDPEVAKQLFSHWTEVWCAGIIAFWIVTSGLVSLVVARWWQALLYNPGGFKQEFHGLRLNLRLGLVCAASLVYCQSRGGEYEYWSKVFSVPLVVVGLGVMHAAISRFRFGTGAVVFAYFGLLVVSPVALLLAAVGFSDLWLDYRKRFNLQP